MKPYERDWEFLSGCWPEVVFYKGSSKKVADVWADEDSSTCDVADLIAAAPEMARLLARIEALHDSEDAGDVARAICVEWLPEIRAVLRKAGVIADKETR